MQLVLKKMDQMIEMKMEAEMDMEAREGRHHLAPKLQKDAR